MNRATAEVSAGSTGYAHLIAAADRCLASTAALTRSTQFPSRVVPSRFVRKQH